MKQYQQLTQEQRYHISGLIKAGYKQSKIAIELQVHKSTISRELRRNKGERGYRPKQAQEKAEARQLAAYKFHKLNKGLVDKINEKLAIKWSPEQISGHFAREDIKISHETIYLHIYRNKNEGGTLYQHLRHANKKYKKRYGSNDKRGQLKNRISIDERPSIVADKARFGDWEMDLVIGKDHQGALLTIVERVSKFTIIEKLSGKNAIEVERAAIKSLLPYQSWLHSITVDNGKEFSGHESISKTLNTKFYFAHPYSSWERGLNENTNGLIRQYFPKKLHLKEISHKQVQFVALQLNKRPRKTLDYISPMEIIDRHDLKKVA